MNFFLQYIRIEFKRAVRGFLSGLATLIIISCITAGSAAALFTLLQSLGVSEPVKVAVSTPGEGNLSRLAIRLLEGMDSISAVCTFELTDENSARKGVAEATYGAAIILPENFYEGVNTGINPPALILIPSEMSDDIRSFTDLLETSASLVDTVEGGIYAVTDAYYTYGCIVSKSDMENYLTNIAFDTLLGRTKLFGESFETSLDVDGLISYYTVCACLLTILVTCTGFGYLYSKRTRVVEFSLKRNGLGSVKTGIIRFVLMMGQLILITAGFALAVKILSHIFENREEENLKLAGESLLEACGVLTDPVCVFPVLFCICGFSHLLYRIFRGRDDAGLIILVIFMIMLLVGGCVVPSVFLPDKAVMIGNYLPAALWREDIFNGGALRELILGSVFFAGGEVLSCFYA